MGGKDLGAEFALEDLAGGAALQGFGVYEPLRRNHETGDALLEERVQFVEVDLDAGFGQERGDDFLAETFVRKSEDGDLVVLEHGMTPRIGDVVAALIDNESTLKTFLLNRSKPFLRAENPKFPDLIPAQELVIQGVMVALSRKRK